MLIYSLIFNSFFIVLCTLDGSAYMWFGRCMISLIWEFCLLTVIMILNYSWRCQWGLEKHLQVNKLSEVKCIMTKTKINKHFFIVTLCLGVTTVSLWLKMKMKCLLKCSPKIKEIGVLQSYTSQFIKNHCHKFPQSWYSQLLLLQTIHTNKRPIFLLFISFYENLILLI